MKDFLIFSLSALVVSTAFISLGQIFNLLPNYGSYALGTNITDVTPSQFYCSKDEPYAIPEINIQHAARGMKFATDVAPGKG
jgi:hypothetical protein